MHLSEAQPVGEVRVLPVTCNHGELRISSRLRRTSSDLIVFMHGFGCSQETFNGAFGAESLSSFSIYTFDFPGHGASSRMETGLYSLQSYADITNYLIDRIECRRVFLVCHSMGGAVGLIASQVRRDVECLVSIEGNLVSEDCGIISRTTADQTQAEFINEGYWAFLSYLSDAPRRDYAAWARWCKQADPVALHECARSLVEWSDSGKLLELFRSLPNKVYIYGDAEIEQYLLPKIRKIPTYHIPDSGHFAMLDNPLGFYSTLAKALP
jgi:pimeloyl-ACP methyl ester carboxylesterase